VNPRQRRGAMLMGLAGLGALAVFAAVASYVASVRRQVDPKVMVVMLDHNVSAMSPIDLTAVHLAPMPEKWMPPRALHSLSALGGLVAGTDLPDRTVLQDGMLVAPPSLQPRQRELAVLVDASTGVAGKISPGSVVDIEASFDGDQRSAPRSEVVVPDAQIITVGTPQQGTTHRFGPVAGLQSVASSQVVPVTFALSPEDTLKVTYAESFASEVRLALIRRNDSSQLPGPRREYSLPGAKQPAPR